ncbi:MAG TPA: hypothetical protein VEI97_15660 [bacterium]|nr:hypothetical protein [bacterium]
MRIWRLRGIVVKSVVLLAIAVGALVVWLQPPPPRVPPALPDSWAPGGIPIAVQWHREPPPMGRVWQPLPLAVTAKGVVIGSAAAGGTDLALEWLGRDGSRETLALGVDRALGFVQRDDTLWTAVSMGTDGPWIGGIQLPALVAQGSVQVPKELLPPLAYDTGPLLDLPDGTLALPLTPTDFSHRSVLVVYDPATGVLSSRPMPDHIVLARAHYFAEHGILYQQRGQSAKAYDCLTAQEVDAGPFRAKAEAMMYSPTLLQHSNAIQVEERFATLLAAWRISRWVQTLGYDGARARVAGLVDLQGYAIAPSGAAPGDAGRPLDGDLLQTAHATARPVAHFKRGVSTGAVDVIIQDGLALIDTADGGTLILQAVGSPPATLNDGEGLLRLGVLGANTGAIDWRAWLPLPAGIEAAALRPSLIVHEGVWTLVAAAPPEGAAANSPTELFWTTLPVIEGVTLEAGVGHTGRPTVPAG